MQSIGARKFATQVQYYLSCCIMILINFKEKIMQLQLNVNDLKSNFFLELLDVFKKDDLIKDYKIIKTYNHDEKQILDDLKEFKIDLTSNDHKTDKYIQIDDA